MLHEKDSAVFFVEGVFPGPIGGAIFFGKTEVGRSITAIIDYKWKGRLPAKYEVWRVNGDRKPYSQYPEIIHAKGAAPVVPPIGLLTRRFLCEGKHFRGFGFGPAKLEKLEEGLAGEGVSVRDALNSEQVELMTRFLPAGMVENLVMGWRQSVKDCDILEFLERHGFDRSLAGAVSRVFKTNVVARLRENPFRLLAFGTAKQSMWQKAEAAAILLGIDRKDPRRLVASVEQALYDQLESGNTLVGLDEIKHKVMNLLKTKSEALFEKAIRAAAEQKIVVRCGCGLQALGPAIMEARVERKLASIANFDAIDSQFSLFDQKASRLEEMLSQVDAEFAKQHGAGLNDEQLEAIRVISSSFFCVVSGGIGTDKRTIMRAVHYIAEQTGREIFQMALAGPAKERLEKATGGRRAFTIHGFIESLKKGKDAPESKDAVVVKEGAHIVIYEASMVDLTLLHKLLSHLPDKVRLCFVGDPGQFLPVGFGVVFHRLVGVKGVRNVELTKIVRQRDVTGILGVSLLVRHGHVPTLQEFGSIEEFGGIADGVSFVKVEATSGMAEALYEITKKLGHDCQVLCARRRFSEDSSNRINRVFQYRRIDVQKCERLARWGMFVGDPVILTRNSYELNLYTGALGKLECLDRNGPIFRFGNREILSQ